MADKGSSLSSKVLEQFLIEAKSIKDEQVVDLISRAIESPGLYVFGELLDLPKVQSLQNGLNVAYFQLLQLFAYGTYTDYKARQSEFPKLSPVMLSKLKQLTIVSLATEFKNIPYIKLQEALDIQNTRELEDLIIEVICANIIRGKLDQKNAQLEVDYAIGRDIRPQAIKEMVIVLGNWSKCCENVLQNIETQMANANEYKIKQNKEKERIEEEVKRIRADLQSSQHGSGSGNAESEEPMVTESGKDAVPEKSTKKGLKLKGLKSTKLGWSNK